MSRYLDRVSKLLNQAERAPEGSPERAAFMEKAVALAQANSIDLAVARAHQANKEKVEQIEERRVQVGQYISHGWSSRTSNNTKWLAELLTDIASPNDVNILISKDSMFVYLIGFPSDLDVVERLYASLAVQMVSEADALIKKGAHKRVERVRRTKRVENPRYIPENERFYPEERNDPFYTRKTIEINDDDEHGNPVYVDKPVSVDGRVWRANFYRGFIRRVSSRMWEERRNARAAAQEADADESKGVALALRDKDSERKKDWEERTKFVRGTHSGPEVSEYVEEGLVQGQKAGARASLGTEARVGNEQRKEIG
jgi:hypothetical protein